MYIKGTRGRITSERLGSVGKKDKVFAFLVNIICLTSFCKISDKRTKGQFEVFLQVLIKNIDQEMQKGWNSMDFI